MKTNFYTTLFRQHLFQHDVSDDGGLRQQQTKRSKLISFILLIMFACGLWITPEARAGNLKNEATLAAKWIASERRINIKQTLADHNGSDDWYQYVKIEIDGKLIIETTHNKHSANTYEIHNVTSHDNYGTVVCGGLSAVNGSTINWYVKPKNTLITSHQKGMWVDLFAEFYPKDEHVGKTLTFKSYAKEGNSSVEDVRIVHETIVNPLSPIELQNVRYNDSPSVTFDVSRPEYNPHDNNTKIYLEWFKIGAANPYKTTEVPVSNKSLFTYTTPNISSSEIAEGFEFRLKYEKPYDNNATGPKQGTKFPRSSNKVKLLPIKLPTSLGVEDIGCRKLKLTWATNSSGQSNQAGKTLIYNSSNSLLASVDYNTKQYEYTIPTSDINKGKKTYSFKITREPFKYSSVGVVQTVSITKNMNYRQMSNFSITRTGGKSFNLSWRPDDGFYCDDFKYLVIVKQGLEEYRSAPINITADNFDVDVSSANFDFCSPTEIYLQMLEDNNVRTTKKVKDDYVFVSTENLDSKIELFSVSKGYYAQRVQVDWTTSKDNQFTKYLLYRKEYGSSVDGNGTLVATINHSSGVTTYSVEDINAVPGIFYEYTLEGQMDCGINRTHTIDFKTSVGYILPFGTVSGRISYLGSQAVQGVTVVAQGDGDSRNKALDFSAVGQTYIQTPYTTGMLSEDALTFQAWVQIREENSTTIQSLMDAPGKYNVEVDGEDLWLSVYKGNLTEYTEYQFTKANFKRGEYQHITITYSVENLTGKAVLYIDGAPVDTVYQEITKIYDFPSSTDPEAEYNRVYFGRYFEDSNYLNGYLDEVRLWNRVLTPNEITQNYNTYISGREEGLKLYYRFDELNGFGEVYDLSGKNNNFNENHGRIFGTIARTSEENNIPSEAQLAIKAVTDKNGNYLINTIPYTGNGSSYNLIPMMGVHSFEPSSRPLYFSSNSTTHNNIDFTDVSSFTVSGKIVYEGGTYPVEGCVFEVDGVQLTINGKPAMSDVNGEFSIKVPIGEHKVQVKKTGHVFLNDGLLLDAETGGDRNYNTNISNITFYDQTRIKLVGHVVGGKREADKESGFGLRNNNIGSDVLKLTAAKERYKLSTESDNITSRQQDTMFVHNTDDKWGKWTNPQSLPNDTTYMTINGNDITIHVSPVTGEYVAWIYPEVYTIGEITAGNYAAIYTDNETLDLSKTPVMDENLLMTSILTYTDSVWIDKKGTMAGHWEYKEISDTIRFHKEWGYYYQAQPSYTVKQIVKGLPVDYFGDAELKIDAEITIPLVSLVEGSDPLYLFDNKPIFRQGEPYRFRLSAFEEYVNGTEIDTAPVQDGIVSFTGTLALDTDPDPIELDSLGMGVYTFLGGMADLTTGINSLSTMINIDGYNYYSTNLENGLEAYVLGGKSTGTDFLTAADDRVNFILHDPPGSNSYAYVEKGSSVTTSNELSISEGFSLDVTAMGFFGAKTLTIAGVGVMTGGETEVYSKLGGQVEFEAAYTYNRNFTETFTYTDRLETSSDPLFVGHQADVFVGAGTNTLYGLTNNIAIAKKTDFDTSEILFSDPQNEYAIGKQVSLALGLSFGTQFMFTGYEIENTMIPKWKDILKNQLVFSEEGINPDIIENPVYVSKLEIDDPNFGKRNDDKDAFGSAATENLDGPSYKLILPTSLREKIMKGMKVNEIIQGTIEFTDSIIYYNDKIKQWENILADNERRKVEATYTAGNNISFGGGVSIEKSQSNDSITTTERGWSITNNIYVVTDNVLKVHGNGMSLEASSGLSGEESGSTGTETTESNTVGFVLEESGNTDEITLDWGFDKESFPETYMFRTRGGRTSCPYEGEVRTKYFYPGSFIINEGTMQIEVPKLAVSGNAYRVQVPATRPAVYTLNLTNESETNGTGYFVLTVDEETNPDGAVLKIDGLPIGNGRYFSVESGQVLTKTLTIEKGPNVDSYENIKLVLASDCDEDIYSEIYVSAIYLPACSEVDMKYPTNNWIMNTSTGESMLVELENYDVNFANFGYVELQYRPASSATWSSEVKFYANEEKFNAAQGENKILLSSSDNSIKYYWEKGQRSDGEYELRAHVVCETESGLMISEHYTEAVRGVVDMSRPEAMGSPSPVNGILTASDEISITFNEDIQPGMLTSNNFSISGILNGDIIAEPAGGLSFTGTESAYTEMPFYTNDSFSIETWFKRDNSTAGTLFSYGMGDNYLSLGFDAEGYAVVTVGNETRTSTSKISNTTRTWKYIGLSYDRDKQALSVYAWQDSDPTIKLFESQSFNTNAPTQGRLYVGSKADGSSGFKGAIAQLHFYDTNRTDAEMSLAKSNVKSGSETNLVGLWEMNESEGSVAKDKARSRNLVVNSGWYIYPVGKSLEFDGIDQYAKFSGINSTFLSYDDFSIEMWFKGDAQENANLLFIESGTQIGFDDSGDLFLSSHGNGQRLSSKSLLDNNWHHLAISVKRAGSTNVLIDGKLESTFSSSIFEKSIGGFYHLGARYIENTGEGSDYDQYFKGNIDEVRIWNTALSNAAVALNKNNKLRGIEAGLKAYYPFEIWTKNIDGTYNVLASNKDMADESLEVSGTAVSSNVAVGVQDARSVTNVPHTFTASSDKVVLNITEELYKIEGVTLEIKAKGILDMRGNESKPAAWIAYVNRNPLNWDRDDISLVVAQGDAATFNASISNNSGATTDYYIDNLPAWLSVNQASGTLQPLATKELTFTVYQGVNIGNYEVPLSLTSGNGVQKLLSVQLKVTGQAPDWSVNPFDYESNMNITGRIQIMGIEQEDEDDLLAAFIGDECVGLCSPIYVPEYNAYFTFMTVYGNSEHMYQTLTLKLWDASTGNIYPLVESKLNGDFENLVFQANAIKGEVNTPVIHNARDIIQQTIELASGWNWVSFNIENSDPDLLQQVTDNVRSKGKLLKSQNDGYIQAPSWVGELSSLHAKNMYMLQTNAAHRLEVSGEAVKPANLPITLAANGWTWIGYTPQFTLPVNSALAGLNAQVGDQIKGHTAYRTYTGATGWLGSLNYMRPGEGFMYYSKNSSPQTFNYPSAASQYYKVKKQDMPEAEKYWNANVHKYANNMTITGYVEIDGEPVHSDQIEIAAFVGDECRGSIMLTNYGEQADLPQAYMVFLVIYGDESEELQFKAYSHEDDKEYLVLNDPIMYATNKVLGNPFEPFKFVLEKESGIGSLKDIFTIYPNPARDVLHIQHSFGQIDELEITDISGRTLTREIDFTQNKINIATYPEGVYLLKMTINNERYVYKFMKR